MESVGVYLLSMTCWTTAFYSFKNCVESSCSAVDANIDGGHEYFYRRIIKPDTALQEEENGHSCNHLYQEVS